MLHYRPLHKEKLCFNLNWRPLFHIIVYLYCAVRDQSHVGTVALNQLCAQLTPHASRTRHKPGREPPRALSHRRERATNEALLSQLYSSYILSVPNSEHVCLWPTPSLLLAAPAMQTTVIWINTSSVLVVNER